MSWPPHSSTRHFGGVALLAMGVGLLTAIVGEILGILVSPVGDMVRGWFPWASTSAEEHVQHITVEVALLVVIVFLWWRGLKKG